MEQAAIRQHQPAVPDDGKPRPGRTGGERDHLEATEVARPRRAGDGEEGEPTKAKGRAPATRLAPATAAERAPTRSTGAPPGPAARAAQPWRPRRVSAGGAASLAGPAGQCHGDPARAAGTADPHRGGGGGRRVRAAPRPNRRPGSDGALARAGRCPGVRPEPRRRAASACGRHGRRGPASFSSDRPAAGERPHVTRGGAGGPGTPFPREARRLLDTGCAGLRPGGGRRPMQAGGRGALDR